MNFQNLTTNHYHNGPCAILHGDHYLWDSWCFTEGLQTHLYALAVERRTATGELIEATQRNEHPFHIHHFVSRDGGASWHDEGIFLRRGASAFDARSIWSGSITVAPDGDKLMAYTGIAEHGAHRPFVQSMAIARTRDGQRPDYLPQQPVSCPVRDREHILSAGYYLGPADSLGDKNGEEGGPILAWRDPFLWLDQHQRWHMFWSAKSSPTQGVIGHALLRVEGADFHIDDLYPPIFLPQNDYTQIELPKIYFDQSRDCFYLLAANCNRLNESQPANQTNRHTCLYRSNRLEDGWQPCFGNDGIVPDSEGTYGVSVIKEDFAQDRLLCIAPLDDRAGENAFGFSRTFYITLD